MKQLILSAAMILMAATLFAANAAPPLVDAGWVKANACKAGVVVLDIRGPGPYDKAHVPCAIETNYAKDGWRVNKDGVAGVLPPPEKLSALIGRLGIGNDNHVVVVPEGKTAADLAAATRVFWTFVVLGHDNVSVLNGGMTTYGKDESNPMEKGAGKPRTATTFRVALRTEMVPGAAEVAKAMKNGTTLMDSRPNDQFLGINKSGKVKRPGTIPGSVNLPGLWTTKNGGGELRPVSQLSTLFKTANMPTNGDQIVFCNTGHWASLGWFVSSQLMGNSKALMYDGSLAEWSIDPSHPMEAKVKL